MKQIKWKEDVDAKRTIFTQVAMFLKKEGLDADAEYDYNTHLFTWTFPDSVSDHFIDMLREEINSEWCRAVENAAVQATKNVTNHLKRLEELHKESAVRSLVWKTITENEDL